MFELGSRTCRLPTSGKLWNITELQFPPLLEGSLPSSESQRDIIDIKGLLASAWYLEGAQKWTVVHTRLLQIHNSAPAFVDNLGWDN